MSIQKFGFKAWNDHQWKSIFVDYGGDLPEGDLAFIRLLLEGMSKGMTDRFIESGQWQQQRDMTLTGVLLELLHDWNEQLEENKKKKKTFKSNSRRQENIKDILHGMQQAVRPSQGDEDNLDNVAGKQENKEQAGDDSWAERISQNLPPLEAALQRRKTRLAIWKKMRDPQEESITEYPEEELVPSGYSQASLSEVLVEIRERLQSYRDFHA
jgi:hypothetical protein